VPLKNETNAIEKPLSRGFDDRRMIASRVANTVAMTIEMAVIQTVLIAPSIIKPLKRYWPNTAPSMFGDVAIDQQSA